MGSATSQGRRRKSPPAAPTLAAGGDGDEYVELVACASELKTTTQKLRRMSLRGHFPPTLVVTRKHILVRRSEYQAWKEGRWSVNAELRAQIVVEAATEKRVVNRRAKGKQS